MVSMMTLVVLGVQRYLCQISVAYKLETFKSAVILITLIWSLVFVAFTAPPLLGWGKIAPESSRIK